MKTRNLIIICILAIFYCLIIASNLTNNHHDYDNNYLNESNYTNDLNLIDYNQTYNISELLVIILVMITVKTLTANIILVKKVIR